MDKKNGIALIVRKLLHRPSESEEELPMLRLMVGSCVFVAQDTVPPVRRIFKRPNRLVPANVALASGLLAIPVDGLVATDLPEPGDPFLFRPPLELINVFECLEQRILHQV